VVFVGGRCSSDFSRPNIMTIKDLLNGKKIEDLNKIEDSMMLLIEYIEDQKKEIRDKCSHYEVITINTRSCSKMNEETVCRYCGQKLSPPTL